MCMYVYSQNSMSRIASRPVARSNAWILPWKKACFSCTKTLMADHWSVYRALVRLQRSSRYGESFPPNFKRICTYVYVYMYISGHHRRLVVLWCSLLLSCNVIYYARVECLLQCNASRDRTDVFQTYLCRTDVFQIDLCRYIYIIFICWSNELQPNLAYWICDKRLRQWMDGMGATEPWVIIESCFDKRIFRQMRMAFRVTDHIHLSRSAWTCSMLSCDVVFSQCRCRGTQFITN